MSGPDGPRPPDVARPASDLRVRLASAVVMVAIAGGALWLGGWVFAVVVGIASSLILLEWTKMSGPYAARMADRAAIAFVGVSVVASFGQPLVSLAAVAAVAFVVWLFGTVDRPMRWLGAGVLYAGLPGIAAVALRGGDATGVLSAGLQAILFVFLVVWATDSAAYFAGRRLGGPKLAPRFSPKKTWSGAIGGATAAVLIGVLAGLLLSDRDPVALGLVALALSAVSQVGDLGESAMKRHFGVKDSGRLIPGHGGIMDRVDGLVAALVLAAAIGLARTGGADAALGLLVW